MKKFLFVAISLLVSTIIFAGAKEKIEPSLLEKYSSTSVNSVIIVLKQQADVSLAIKLKTKIDRANFVIDRLKNIANSSQSAIVQELETANVLYKSFYIVNALQARLDLDMLLKIASMDEVKMILNDADTPMQMIREERNNSRLRDGKPEWGITRIKADSVWLLGYKGAGVIVAGQDTGYDYDLDLIIKKYRGYVPDDIDQHNYNWHDAIHDINPFNVDSTLVGIDSLLANVVFNIDSIFMDTVFVGLDTLMIDSIYVAIDSTDRGQINPCGLNSLVPCDDHGHGSHTMGTIVGGDTTDIIGVAPDAKWISCRNMERGWGRPSTYMECFEWFMNPTDLNGENADPTKAPHVIANSWGCPPVEGCDTSNFSIMEEVVNNVKSSGIVVVVSAGNDGPYCESIANPASMFEGSFTVGATQPNDTIASFSSRGAVTSDASYRMKPNISAPGVAIRSCLPGNKFGSWSGTSMAGPHVAGVVALMISANPELAGQVEIIEDIIESTALPLTSKQSCNGDSGQEIPNNTYGFGRIDAYAAVKRAEAYNVNTENSYIKNNSILTWPNPVEDILGLYVYISNKDYTNKESDIELNVYDTNGNNIMNKSWRSVGNLYQELDFEGFSSGIYILNLRIDKNEAVKKIVKL